MSQYTFEITFSGGRTVRRTVEAFDRKQASIQVMNGLNDWEADHIENLETLEVEYEGQ